MRKLRILLCVIAPAWALGAFLPASAPAAVDMFMQADGLLGESQASKYKDAIDVLAWSWGASNTISATSGPTAVGKPNLQDLSFTKYIDRSSPVIFSNLMSGKVIPKAKLTVVKAGENPVPYIRLCFTGVRLTSVSTGGSGGEDRLTENVSFAYATVVEAYQQQVAVGSPPPPVFGGWDLINRLQYRDETC